MPTAEELNRDFQTRLDRVLARMAQSGYPMKVVSGKRTRDQQRRLYDKGRKSPGRIVTNADGTLTLSQHQTGEAADLAFLDPSGQPTFEGPWDQFGMVATDEGLEWGGFWPDLQDRPHLELDTASGEAASLPMAAISSDQLVNVLSMFRSPSADLTDSRKSLASTPPAPSAAADSGGSMGRLYNLASSMRTVAPQSTRSTQAAEQRQPPAPARRVLSAGLGLNLAGLVRGTSDQTPVPPATADEPSDEAGFRAWYGKVARATKIHPDPDHPKHYYDYRAAYRAGVRGPDEHGHWPSQYKQPGHPFLIVNGIDTRTGQRVTDEGPSLGLNLSGLIKPQSPSEYDPERLVLGLPPKQDERSLVRRGLDVALTPLVSQEAARRLTGSVAPLPDRGLVGTVKDIGGAIVDLPGLLWREPRATLRGAAAGVVEGAAQLTDPVTIASLFTGGGTRAIRPALVRALRGLDDVERAIIAARASGNLPEIVRLRREIGQLTSQAEIARKLQQFARRTDIASGTALAASGVERLADADTLPEYGAGLAQLAFGALGARTATRVTPRRPPIQVHAGELPPARGYSVTPEGVAMPPGREVPVARQPDASFVRGEPAQYARRETRALLPAGPRFVGQEAGPVVPTGTEIPPQPRGADTSYVRGERAQVLDQEFGRRVYGGAAATGEAQAAPTRPLLDVTPQGEGARLAEAEARLAGQTPDFASGVSPDVPRRGIQPGTRGGAPVFRPQPPSPEVESHFRTALDGARRHGFTGPDSDLRAAFDQRVASARRLQAEMAEIAGDYSPRAFLQAVADAGGLDIAAAKKYGILDVNEVFGAERGVRGVFQKREMFSAAQRLKTRRTHKGLNLSELAQVLRQDHRWRDVIEDEQSIAQVFDEIRAQKDPDPVSLGQALDAAGVRPDAQWWKQPFDEEGFIRTALAMRAAGGLAGAAYGGATGEDTKDRIKRALLFGGAGALAPSLLRSGTGQAVIGRTIAGQDADDSLIAAVRRSKSVRPEAPAGRIPPAQPIPKRRLLEFPSLQKMPEQVRGEIADLMEKHSGFADQRRNVQPIARTEAAATRIDVPLERLTPGRVLNAEELQAYKDAVAGVMAQRQPLVEKIRSGKATDLEKLKFSELTDTATVLVASYRGAKAEAGRALNILRVKARVLEYGDQAFIEQALKSPGFDEDTKRVAEAVAAAAGDPIKQLEILRAATRGTRFERAQALYYNWILSGLRTHLRNTIGNSFNALSNLVNVPAAATADIIRSKVTGAKRSVFYGESGPSLVGFFTGIPVGLRNARFTLRHGFTPEAASLAASGKFDAPRVEAPGGLIMNLPSRALEGMDQVFREPARQLELFAGAYAQARKEGLSRQPAIQQRMTELLTGDSPISRRLREQADRFGARSVFQEPSGPIVSKFLALKNDPNVPVPVRAVVTFIAPFMKTPGNILRQGAEFSPLGFLMKAVRQEGREGAQALGRAGLGTIAAGTFAYLAATGKLTGAAPSDRTERAAFMESGKRPNSIKVRLSNKGAQQLREKGAEVTPAGTGEFWINYQLFQPFSVQMAAIANAYARFEKSDRSDKAAEESVYAALAGAGASFIDSSFLKGVNDFLDAVSDPERGAGQGLATFVQGLVPASGLARNVTQAIDPTVRQPEGVVESVATIIPGLSSQVPARLDRFGREVVRPGGPIRRGFTVPEVSEETSDDVAATLARLGITPDLPASRMMWRGKPVAFTRDEDFIVRKAKGLERRHNLERLIGAEWFSGLSEDRQRKRIEDALQDAGETVRRKVLGHRQQGRKLTLEGLLSPTALAAEQRMEMVR